MSTVEGSVSRRSVSPYGKEQPTIVGPEEGILKRKHDRELEDRELPQLRRGMTKRQKREFSYDEQCERVQAGCSELLGELEDLERAVIEDYLLRHWFTGTRILINPPIHSTNPDSKVIADCDLRRWMLEASYLGATEADNVFDKVTHVVIYHRKGQVIPPKNILRSFGGIAEQDMVTFSHFLNPGGVKIEVVYHDWLEDSLCAKRVLPVTGYRALT